MKYLIETGDVYTINGDYKKIALFTNGKTYFGTIPKRGDDIDVLINGLLGMVGFLRKISREEHDAECKGVVK